MKEKITWRDFRLLLVTDIFLSMKLLPRLKYPRSALRKYAKERNFRTLVSLTGAGIVDSFSLILV